MSYEEAVWASDLPSTQKLLALAWAHSAVDGRSQASFASIAADASLSRSSAIRGTKALVSAGWLKELERVQYKETTYGLSLP